MTVRLSKLYLLILLFLFSLFPAIAQEESADVISKERKDIVFSFAPTGEAVNYDIGRPVYGYGFRIAYDGSGAVGIAVIYFNDVSDINDENRIYALEITAFVRMYFFPNSVGPFLQFNLGPILSFDEDEPAFSNHKGSMSIGASLGWRIPLGNYLYVEPAVRGGYPFLYGGGLSIGIRL